MNEQALALTDTRVLSRIDRSIADNLDSLKKAYGRDHEIARDFILFITKNLKTDFFGFSKFTMSDFINVVGRDRRELSSKHEYLSVPGAEVVEYGGHKFLSVFDYVLHLLQSRVLIFTKTYSYALNGNTVDMDSIQIIKQLKISTLSDNNNKKVYEIRLSDDFLNGFVSRYYSFDLTGYPLVGKGKGGDGRKSLYLFLSKAMHQNLANNVRYSWYAVTFLCNRSDLNFAEPAERKRAIKKYLDNLIEKGGLGISYEFVDKIGSLTKHIRGFYVKVDFKPDGVLQVKETKSDHHFHSILSSKLKEMFQHLHGNKDYVYPDEESDPYQRWLSNNDVDMDYKRSVLMECYKTAYKKHISVKEANKFIKGTLSLKKELFL